MFSSKLTSSLTHRSSFLYLALFWIFAAWISLLTSTLLKKERNWKPIRRFTKDSHLVTCLYEVGIVGFKLLPKSVWQKCNDINRKWYFFRFFLFISGWSEKLFLVCQIIVVKSHLILLLLLLLLLLFCFVLCVCHSILEGKGRRGEPP